MDGKLIVPTNWDLDLLRRVAPLRPAYLYGSLAAEASMRTMLELPEVTERQIGDFVERARKHDIKLLYVMNATCTGNREMSEEGRWEALQRCQWMVEVGFAGIVLANPLLMEVVKKHFPDLELHVSLLASVDEPRKAIFFRDLGAAVIHLDPIVARDFRRLRAIRSAVDCRLSVVVNEGCLLHCPIRAYHANVISHSLDSIKGRYHVDYCYYKCAAQKITDRTELLRIPWIRPEDTRVYLEEGIDHLKIAGREKMGGGPSSHSSWIARTAEAYYKGRCKDVAELLVGIDGIRSLCGASIEQPDIHIDSGKLDGFLRFFAEGRCDMNCTRCRYCDAWADKAVRIDGDADGYVEQLESSLEGVRLGSYWTGAPQ